MMLSLHNDMFSVEINSFGAELSSMKDENGTEYIWYGDPAYWSGRSPVLFPAVGVFRDGQTIIDGKAYRLPKHGFARRSAFELLNQTKDTAVFRLSDNASTREVYPFSFNLTITYTLEADCLAVKYEVENHNEREMPYSLGLHTAFLLPTAPAAAWQAEHPQEGCGYVVEFEKAETFDSPLMDMETGIVDLDDRVHIPLEDGRRLTFDHRLFDHDALSLTELHSKKVALRHLPTDTGVEITFDGFDMFGLWTPNAVKAPFLCLEPWAGIGDTTGSDGVFAHKKGIRILAAGETDIYHYAIRPIR